MRKYNIKSEHTEPRHPQQNQAERKIGEVKRYTRRVMDRTGAPGPAWFLYLLYVVMLLNVTVTMGATMTPEQSCFGTTSDLSPFLQHTFYEKVLYGEHD